MAPNFKIQIRDTGSWINIPDPQHCNLHRRSCLNKFSNCRDKLLFQGRSAKAKKAGILIPVMYHSFRIKTWPGSGWKNNKYGKRQLYLADGLGHVEGSLHQL
jgi:hypothetical protein